MYLVVAGSALLFPHRVSSWPWLLAVHILLISVLWPLPLFAQAEMRLGDRAQRVLRTTLDWLPLLIIPALYTELAVLNLSVHDGRYFDDIILRWEETLFGGQPSRSWAAAVPSLWLSEPLHAAYLSYYFIIWGPPFVIFMSGRLQEFRTCVFILLLSFFAHYVFFIYFPVQGPRYLFPAPGGEIARGSMYQLAHYLLEAGSSQGAAFPSSHVGVSVAQTLIAIRYLPRLAPLVALLTIGLAAGAVYGGFHYATDAFAGLLLGTLAFVVAPHVARRFERSAVP